MINNIIFGVLTYLFASIPFGLLIAKVFYNKDITKEGSKNIGATNVFRLCGKFPGFVTFLLDGLKGAIPVLLAKLLFQGNFFYIVATLAILGHIFPIYLKFQGGKGVATTLLILFAINWQIGLIALIIWVAVLLLFGFSSVSSIVMSLAIIPFSVFNLIQTNGYEFLIFNIIFTSLIIMKHKLNIIKLINNEEKKVFKKALF